jgi:hypothetical protein
MLAAPKRLGSMCVPVRRLPERLAETEFSGGTPEIARGDA